MHRIFLDFLRNRSLQCRRVPLLVRGARQIGKSHSIREYGNTEFDRLLEVNLELSPPSREIFKSLDVAMICRELEILSKVKLVDGKTLLFIDEIQDSPEAILALRAFKERRPHLDIVAAGSLLEFALDEETLRSFPVGRVGFAWMHPMSFREFLMALGEWPLLELLRETSLQNAEKISKVVHEKLLGLVREFYLVGGMPEVVDVYRETRSFLEVKNIQTRLMTGYIADFVKYGARYDHRKLQTIMNAVPRLVGQRFKFSHVDPQARARDLKTPLLDLEKAGLIRLVRATSANGVPLASEEREGIFKALFLDIGLMLNILRVELGAMPIQDALFANEGALAEQFVGQELLAHSAADWCPQLYFWQRDVKGSEAEVDYVLPHHDLVIPLEVKAGKTGRLKSARIFSTEKKSKVVMRISQHPLSYHDGVLSVPFYMCSEIQRLLDEVL